MYLLLTVYSMRRHTSKMHYKEDDLVTNRFIVKINIYIYSKTRTQSGKTFVLCHAGETHFIY